MYQSESKKAVGGQIKHRKLVKRMMKKHGIGADVFANIKSMYEEIRAYKWKEQVASGKIKGGRTAYRAFYRRMMKKHKVTVEIYAAIKEMYADIKKAGAKKVATANTSLSVKNSSGETISKKTYEGAVYYALMDFCDGESDAAQLAHDLYKADELNESGTDKALVRKVDMLYNSCSKLAQMRDAIADEADKLVTLISSK